MSARLFKIAILLFILNAEKVRSQEIAIIVNHDNNSVLELGDVKNI